MNNETMIFGIRPVMEAIRSGREPDRVLIQKNLRGSNFRELFSLLRKLEIPYQFVPVEKLNRTTRQKHQGVIAWVTGITYQKIEDILPGIFEQGRLPMVLILDGITDVRNLGAIARTAECAGVDAIIVPTQGSAQINPEGVKASAGALYRIPVCRVPDLKASVQFLKHCGLHIFAATGDGPVDYLNTNLVRPLGLILGSEGQGVSGEILNLSDSRVKIPLSGGITSLNVSVAAGILLFEVVRQRKQSG
jgi:23S rRNA (guanosine2251-2'-O)-methyltransferase